MSDKQTTAYYPPGRVYFAVPQRGYPGRWIITRSLDDDVIGADGISYPSESAAVQVADSMEGAFKAGRARNAE